MSWMITGLASFVLSLGAVGLILKISHRKGWYDKPNKRKIHSGDIPRLGGIGFGAVFIIVSAVITLFDGGYSPGTRFLAPLAALVIILVSGAVDDFRPLRPLVKFAFQCVSALCVVIPGYIFTRFFFFNVGWLHPFRIPLTIFWILGMANALNLIDGVDGLAGSLSVLIALSYGAAFVLLQDTGPGLLFCACLVGTVLGFLVFNAPLPGARIFMGDGGSQILGFALALLPLIIHNDGVEPLPLFYAVALVIIPFYDTTAAIWRRLREGRPIASPDKAHLHHKLLNLGLNSRQVDLTICSCQIFLSALVLLSIKAEGLLSLILLVSAYLGGMAFFAFVHFMNRRVILAQKNSEQQEKP